VKDVLLNKISKNLWEVAEDYYYMETFLEKSFKTDGASTPKWIKCAYPSVGRKYTTPSVLHDKWYFLRIPRKIADLRFYKACRKFGVSKETSRIFYIAVRKFGWFSYWKKRK
jgi:hypothetical protein